MNRQLFVWFFLATASQIYAMDDTEFQRLLAKSLAFFKIGTLPIFPNIGSLLSQAQTPHEALTCRSHPQSEGFRFPATPNNPFPMPIETELSEAEHDYPVTQHTDQNTTPLRATLLDDHRINGCPITLYQKSQLEQATPLKPIKDKITGRYHCRFGCGLDYASYSAVNRHERRAHRTAKHICPGCGYSFFDIRNLQKHICTGIKKPNS